MRTLFLSAFFILISTVSSQAVEFEVDDPVENLIGDSRRGYVDITQVRVRQSTTETVIEVSVNKPFPDPSTLLGMGMQFIFTFHDTDTDETGVLLESKVELNEKGWSATHRSIDKALNNDSLSIDFNITPTCFSIRFPALIIGNAETVKIISDTANKPKWRPATSNPPVVIILSHPQDQSQTLSH